MGQNICQNRYSESSTCGDSAFIYLEPEIFDDCSLIGVDGEGCGIASLEETGGDTAIDTAGVVLWNTVLMVVEHQVVVMGAIALFRHIVDDNANGLASIQAFFDTRFQQQRQVQVFAVGTRPRTLQRQRVSMQRLAVFQGVGSQNGYGKGGDRFW